MIGLGIDAGGSSTRWLLLDDAEHALGSGSTGPISGLLFTTSARDEALGSLRALLQDVLKLARPHAVVAGVTGLDKASPVAELLRATIASELGLSVRCISVDYDMPIAYAVAFPTAPGVLVYAGTGAIAYCDLEGTILRAGGHGYLIDDAGGGFWIGQAGLKQVMRWADALGRPADRPLAQTIYGALGSSTWEGIRQAVYGGGRSRLAALAPAVAAAAAQGDDAAVMILKTAGQELGRLAQVLLARLNRPLPVAFAGGITQLSPLLTRAFEETLPPAVTFRVVKLAPVRAAAKLALIAARRYHGT